MEGRREMKGGKGGELGRNLVEGKTRGRDVEEN